MTDTAEDKQLTSRERSNANLIHCKPGQVLNPKGREKGGKNLTTILLALLEQEFTCRNQLTGEEDTAHIDTHLNTSLVHKALLGDMKAQQMIWDRVEGKVIDRSEVSHDLTKVHAASKNIDVKEF